MSGSHGTDTPVMQEIQDGDSKSGTLCRVGSGAELVKETQGILVCML